MVLRLLQELLDEPQSVFASLTPSLVSCFSPPRSEGDQL